MIVTIVKNQYDSMLYKKIIEVCGLKSAKATERAYLVLDLSNGRCYHQAITGADDAKAAAEIRQKLRDNCRRCTIMYNDDPDSLEDDRM